MAGYLLQASFARGELSPRLQGRHDIDHYAMGLATAENVFVLKQGGLRRRSGTKYMGEVYDSLKKHRLIPFQFNEEQSFIIEAGEYYFRFWTSAGVVRVGGDIYSLEHPYAEDELDDIQYIQSADALYLAHRSHAPRRLLRITDNIWSLERITFEDGPFLSENEEENWVTPNGQGQAKDEAAAPAYASTAGTAANAFDNDPATKTVTSTGALPHFVRIDLGVGYEAVVDKYTLMSGPTDEDWTPTSWDIQGSDDGVTFVTIDRRDGETGWAPGERRFYEFVNKVPFRYIQIKFYAVDGGTGGQIAEFRPNSAGDTASEFTLTFDNTLGINGGQGFSSDDVGRQVRLFGDDGFWRYFVVDSVGSTTQVSGRLYGYALHNQNRITRWKLSAWNWYDGFPASVGFYEGRVAWASTVSQPRNVWLSRSLDYDSMVISQPVVDDDSVQVQMHGEKLNRVVWMKESYELVLGTTGEMRVMGKGDIGKAFSPSNVNQKAQVFVGGNQRVPPVAVGSTIIYTDAYRKRLHEFAYNYELNAYQAPELSILSDHIPKRGVVRMAYAQDPDSIIWMPLDNGEVCALTYEKEQKIVGITRHLLAPGKDETVGWGRVKDAQVISTGSSDEVWLIVERLMQGGYTKQYIEILQPQTEVTENGDDILDAWYLDCAARYDGAPTSTISGLTWLEDETVGVFADGIDIGDATVVDGEITLPGGATASKVLIGLRYNLYVKTLDPPTIPSGKDGAHVGRSGQVVDAVIDVLDTIHLLYSSDGGSSWEMALERPDTDSLETPAQPFTGRLRVWGEGDWTADKRIELQTDKAYPATIRSLNVQMEGEP